MTLCMCLLAIAAGGLALPASAGAARSHSCPSDFTDSPEIYSVRTNVKGCGAARDLQRGLRRWWNTGNDDLRVSLKTRKGRFYYDRYRKGRFRYVHGNLWISFRLS